MKTKKLARCLQLKQLSLIMQPIIAADLMLQQNSNTRPLISLQLHAKMWALFAT